MNFYILFDTNVGAEEGACLVVAETGREAKKFGYRTLQDWFDTEFIDIGVNILKDNIETLKKEIDMEKYHKRIPQVIDNPKICPTCELWGGGEVVDGHCEFCKDGEDQ